MHALSGDSCDLNPDHAMHQGWVPEHSAVRGRKAGQNARLIIANASACLACPFDEAGRQALTQNDSNEARHVRTAQAHPSHWHAHDEVRQLRELLEVWTRLKLVQGGQVPLNYHKKKSSQTLAP